VTRHSGGTTRLLVAFSLLVLVSSTVIVGYGKYVGGSLRWLRLTHERWQRAAKSVFDYLDGSADAELTLVENCRREVTFHP